MGSRYRINNKRYLLWTCFAIVLFTICFDGIVFFHLKKSCENTKNIIAAAAVSDSSGDILKWMKELPSEELLLKGKESLAAYGYSPAVQTVWDKTYLTARHRILSVSVFFDLVLFGLFLCLFLLFQKAEEKRVTELEGILRQIQTTSSDPPDLSAIEQNGLLRDRICSLWEQIQTDRQLMEQEKESTKTLVTDISHQLKTPVAALKTGLELLSSEEMTKEEEIEFFDRCMQQIHGLENLTKALVNVSRMEKGMIQLSIQPADLLDTLRSAVSRIYQKASKKQISIFLSNGTEVSFQDSIEMPKDSSPETAYALHDKKWTAEVFVNILDNAVKYSGNDTTIRITIEQLTTYLKVEIQDEGMGIAKSDYSKIFQRFYRGEQVKDIEGSGVGLYLAREIIEKQNGSIFVRAKTHGPGSIFSVQLPKA